MGIKTTPETELFSFNGDMFGSVYAKAGPGSAAEEKRKCQAARGRLSWPRLTRPAEP